MLFHTFVSGPTHQDKELRMRKLIDNRHTTLASFFLSAGLVLGACAPAATDTGNATGSGGSSSSGSGGKSGSGGSGSGGSSSSGSGGSSSSGSGGSSSSGSGGSSSSGSGGSSSGTGGSSSGTGGSSSGTGGSSSGTGGSSSGTGGSGTTDAGGGTDTAAAAPTFTKIYTEVFSVTCMGANCHTGGAPKDGVDFNDKMKAFTSATTKKTQLLSRIKSTNVAQRMPKDKPALAPAVIKMIEDWYAAGGKND
jgi:hypothetical protein